jgi:Family of unknown function (DUF5752)
MKAAERPFQFITASYLIRIGNCKATTLVEIANGLESSSDESIFYHTFQSLSRHHFLTEGFSNDFAQWVLAACNRPELAELLAGLDIRDYLSLTELRRDLLRMVTDYCAQNPQYSQQQAFEPFYFCEALEVAVPLGLEAHSLEEFRAGLESLSHASFHYHFIASRLRLHLRTNDFSNWLETSLGLEALARQVNRVDIYTNTLDSAREKLVALVNEELVR